MLLRGSPLWPHLQQDSGRASLCCLGQLAGTTRRAVGWAENAKATCPAHHSPLAAVITGKCRARSGWAEVGGVGRPGSPKLARAANHPFKGRCGNGGFTHVQNAFGQDQRGVCLFH